MKVKDLVYCAVYVALFLVLDFMSNQINFLRHLNGGSVSLGVIPLYLASYHLGVGKGVLVSLLSIVIQIFMGRVFFVSFLAFTLDYVIAYGCYGLAVLFKNFKIRKINFYSGIVVTSGIRFISATISGMFFYGVPLWGSLVYNFDYIFVTMLICLITVPIIYSRVIMFSKKEN